MNFKQANTCLKLKNLNRVMLPDFKVDLRKDDICGVFNKFEN